MREPRSDAIVEVLAALARHDLARRAPVSPEGDPLDAIAAAVNQLAEALARDLVPRHEMIAEREAHADAEARARAHARLATIGQLASGVAHEFNNPASWVLLGLGIARRRLAAARALPADSPKLAGLLGDVDAALGDATSGINRIRALATDLRNLAKVEHDEREVLALDEVVRAAGERARPALRSVARLELELGGPRRVLGSGVRLGQLVANLISNAAEAIGPGDPERQHIKVSLADDGPGFVLAVEDSGPGIPAEVRERVFEPFFTTRSSEAGGGLGLTLVRQIARQHGGDAIAVEPRSHGARVEVHLPRAPTAPPAAPSSRG